MIKAYKPVQSKSTRITISSSKEQNLESIHETFNLTNVNRKQLTSLFGDEKIPQTSDFSLIYAASN